MPNRRRRATPTRTTARLRANYLAGRLGRAIHESRLALHLTQARAATRAGVSQPFWSRLERGTVTTASLETLAACATAVDVQLAAFIEARPGADLPRDIEHLRRQELVIRTAADAGWRAQPERPIDRGAARSRSIDVLLGRTSASFGMEVAVIEVEDLLADVGEVLRGLSDKVAAVAREFDHGAANEVRMQVAGLLVVRATRRNRTLVQQLGELFRTRFPASSAAWLQAITDPRCRMPDQDGLAWSSVPGDRLFAARLMPLAAARLMPPAAGRRRRGHQATQAGDSRAGRPDLRPASSQVPRSALPTTRRIAP